MPGAREPRERAADFIETVAAAFMLLKHVISTRLGEIEEDDDRRIADGGVMAGEGEAAGLAIHPEDGDVVAALIAAIEELAGGVEVEAARIVPARPFFADERQVAVRADGKDPDAVVQPVARIDKPAIGGNQDLGAEVAAGKPGRQGGDRLPRGQPPRRGIVVKQHDGRAFLLNGVEPTAIGMKMEMPRPVSGRQRDGGRFIRSQHALLLVELPDEDLDPGPGRRAARSVRRDRPESCARESDHVR